MSRREPDPPLELDPLKGGLKHNPFAALRGRVSASDAKPAAAPPAAVTDEDAKVARPKAASAPGGPKVSKPASAPAQERVTVRIERTGRGGKTVTIAEGPGLAGRELEALAREIARGMGTGARVEGSSNVVQGDQRERLVDWLGARGFGGAVAGN
jgi:translation initiation factor 1